MLSFSLAWKYASTKEKVSSMDLPKTCGLSSYYKTLKSYFLLSNFPLLVALLKYGTKYKSIEWNPHSSYWLKN